MLYQHSAASAPPPSLHLPLPPPVLLSPSHSPGSIYNSVGNCWVGFSEGSCCNWFRMQVVSLVMWEEGEDPGPVTRTGGFQTPTFCQIRFWVSGKKKGFIYKKNKRFYCQRLFILFIFLFCNDNITETVVLISYCDSSVDCSDLRSVIFYYHF